MKQCVHGLVLGLLLVVALVSFIGCSSNYNLDSVSFSHEANEGTATVKFCINGTGNIHVSNSDDPFIWNVKEPDNYLKMYDVLLNYTEVCSNEAKTEHFASYTDMKKATNIWISGVKFTKI